MDKCYIKRNIIRYSQIICLIILLKNICFGGMIALYDFEQNTNNSLSNEYNIFRYKCPEVDLYSSDNKFSGLFSFYSVKNGECPYCGWCNDTFFHEVSPTVKNELQSATQFTIFGYMYITDRAGVGRFNDETLFNKTGTYDLALAMYTGSSGCGPDSVVFFRFGGYTCAGNIIYNQWVRYQLEWDGTVYKVYVDGNLKATYTSSVNAWSGADLGQFYLPHRSYMWIDWCGISKNKIYNGAKPKIGISANKGDYSNGEDDVW